LQSQLIQSQSFRLDCQHKDADFSASRRSYKEQQRFFNRQMFRRTHPSTKEVFERSWLCYSPATGKAFCFYCRLFSAENEFVSGFHDWKNATARMEVHGKSVTHRTSAFAQRSSVQECIEKHQEITTV